MIKYIPLFELNKELNEVINLSNSINVNILVIYISASPEPLRKGWLALISGKRTR